MRIGLPVLYRMANVSPSTAASEQERAVAERHFRVCSEYRGDPRMARDHDRHVAVAELAAAILALITACVTSTWSIRYAWRVSV
jgi:hypothetical protein